MAERKLNFNAPLLSVRRFSATTPSDGGVKAKKPENAQLNRRHTLPSYTSDSNSDQVTEPVAVPFHWEQIPGRRKDGGKPEPWFHKEASASKQNPGRPKDGGKTESRVHKEVSVPPKSHSRRVLDVVKHQEGKKTEDRNVFMVQNEGNSSSSNNLTKLDRSKQGLSCVAEKAGLDLAKNDEDEDSYSDALDTLSPTDSFSMNCSASGLSSSDGLVVKPSGTFSTDPQTRDFMMSRFLPAAKAMALEPAHYASRKQSPAPEQQKQIVKVVSRDRTPPVNRFASLIVPYRAPNAEEEESEDEYSGGYDHSVNLRTKACGLIPRICFKSSLSILNPVPGMKSKNQASASSARDIEKLSRAAYNNRSISPMVKKVAAFQHSKDAANKQKPDTGVQSPRLVDIKSKLNSVSNRFASDRQTTSTTTSPFRRSGGISPYRNEARQSPFRGAGFLGIPKEAENLNANRFNLNSKLRSRSQELYPSHGSKRGTCPAVEKTLYVDTVNRARTPCPNSGSSDTWSREMEGTLAKESPFQEEKCPKRNAEPEPEPEDKFMWSDDTDTCLESKALICVNTESDQIPNKDEERSLMMTISEQAPPPPLLPKTPSESWLWRTLPSVATQNLSSRFQGKWQDSKPSSANAKWETIVKSSYLHHDHVRYSEELRPQQSKS